ncbi:hypothetical protein ACHAWF_006778 [Thalassiosira exigua]
MRSTNKETMNRLDDATNGPPREPAAASSSRVLLDELLDHLLADESRVPPSGSAVGGSAGEQSLPSSSRTIPVKRSDSNDPADPTRARRMDAYASRVHDILLGDSNKAAAMSASDHREMKEAFEQWEAKRREVDERKEFESVEAFVLEEQRRTLQQRKEARRGQALEEIKMAADIAEIKGFRFDSANAAQGITLQNKLSDRERAYFQRKMVVAKAAQLANADCRVQFNRARAFFESLHLSRQASLRQSYERSIKVMAITHRLCGTDSRVVALEQQSAERMFRQKEANLNELHMAQNLEEAAYLESMFDLLNKVQTAKEEAVTASFQLQVQDIKNAKVAQSKRDQDIHDLQAEGLLEMTKLVAHYAAEQAQNNEDDLDISDGVARSERRKDFQAHQGGALEAIQSVSELYDSIIWSVATSPLGLSTTGSSIYSESVYYEEEEDKEGDNPAAQHPDLDENDPQYLMGSDGWSGNENATKRLFSEEGSTNSGSISNTTHSEDEDLSVLGKIHVRSLRKELRLKEKTLTKKHASESRAERRQYRKAARELKLKHQQRIDMLLRQCIHERHRLRDDITQRMKSLARNQELSTKTLQESIDGDVAAMQEAWTEHKRLEDAEKSSFDKAQALISAQVFHEVRNALSSVIAMSELTSQLQEDPTITPSGLVSSVNKMLDQNEEVVQYSLTMLNNILDINKIRTGEFQIQKKPFDLTDLMQRATTMQMVKAQARGVKMSFERTPMSCVAYTDRDIVLRIVTNFISNAVKFTSSGAIQPFILPVEKLMPSVVDHPRRSTDESDGIENGKDRHFKMVAVGVADTGIGLSQNMLNKAKAGLYNSDKKGISSGAKNSGFGLHLAHQLAATLDTNIYLADLAGCHGVLNDDISDAFLQHQNMAANQDRKESVVINDVCGTVLFVVIPVFQEGEVEGDLVNAIDSMTTVESENDDAAQISDSLAYKFRPALSSQSNHFRILIADDVLMLRKGLVRSILQVIDEEKVGNCPVMVHTACTAEDALRMISTQPFDLLIMDNQYAPPTNVNRLEGGSEERPHIRHEGTKKLQEIASDFFRSESFTVEEGDGDLSGLQALLRILDSSDSSTDSSIQSDHLPYPTPIPILLSGHKFDLSSYCSMIVVQKPLRTSDIASLLEENAERLIESGLCVKEEEEGGEMYRVVNLRGTQIFSKEK